MISDVDREDLLSHELVDELLPGVAALPQYMILLLIIIIIVTGSFRELHGNVNMFWSSSAQHHNCTE